MLKERKANLEGWNIVSPKEAGFHEVVSPEKSDCNVARVFRLNLLKGQKYTLASGSLEMNAVLIRGTAAIRSDALQEEMLKLDSFYIPGNMEIEILASEDAVFYIGSAPYDDVGKPFFRKFDISLPLGEIHQIHGEGVSAREVFFTLNPEVPASRLICGVTWGGNGAWTSWPPHQHEKDLEEVYCYFDMAEPQFGFHISYLKQGEVLDASVHVVRDGHMVLAPYGYHPTVASPGTRNTYFWVLAAFSPQSRRYDLAIPDPSFSGRD